VSEGPKPITRQRSEWVKADTGSILGLPVTEHRRFVSDGELIAIVAEEPMGWHLSVSFRNHRREHSRYPTWDEQTHAVRALLPTDLTYVSAIPPDNEYVALHDTTFHWHEYPSRPEAAVLGDALKLVSAMSLQWKDPEGQDEDIDERVGKAVQDLARSVHSWVTST
jgi:hypothetical protein